MKKTLLVVATTLIAAQSFAYLTPGGPRPGPLVPGPSGGNVLPPNIQPPLAPGPLPVPQPVGNRVAQAYIGRTLNHGDIISVRRELNDLRQGDLVKTLEGMAQGLQRGAYLEVVIDAVVIARVNLSQQMTPFRMEIRKVNGVDYQRLVLRSIGSSYVESIAAVIGEDAVPPMPPPIDDPGVYPGNPSDPYPVDPYPPQQPDPQQPPLVPGPPGSPNQPPLVPGPPGSNPGHPGYPPNNSLAGYCDDYDHSQFTAAKNFAYSSNGLDLTSNGATDWALNYNQTHACYTISEYQSRFSVLKNFAYASNGLDMTARDSVQYALSKVENTSVQQAQQMQTTLSAIKTFAYASNGLDLTSADSANLARNWIDRGYCEDERGIQVMAERYRTEYNFAYSSGGLNYTSAQAKQYALDRIRNMTACGDLLR